ncbi:MAG: Gfo/Idh/MocA family oxidoreductase [Planctomycetes bacterium]|nr:Gfo/Idh/MocA family oxidoreductase [Planctomycetota bacterium]
MSGPRVGIVGARRRRQGLGPFVARGLAAAGAEVVAFVGTSDASVAEAASGLARIAGLQPQGYTSLDAMFAAERLDAVAILSPAEHHREHLRRCLDARVSVLCEKPFLWGRDDDLPAAVELLDDFAAAGLIVRENAQWPYTLPAFFALHPEARGEPVVRFAMRQQPASRGVEMIGDALPHALSLLDALAPGDEVVVRDVRCSSHDRDAEALALRFAWVADGRPVEALVELDRAPSQPREAGYDVNGRRAQRLVRLADYAQFFAAGAALVDVPDPLPLLLADFVADLRADATQRDPTANRRIVQRLSALDSLRAAFLRDDP